MNTILNYQITVRWSQQDESFEASIPALHGCLAYADSAVEAVTEVLIAAELWLQAAAEHGKIIPRPDATRERLASLAPILNMSRVAREAGIPVQTIATKIKRGTPLSDVERESVSRVLAAHGVE